MGERLVIETTILNANRILEVIKDPELLVWEWAPHQLDVAARWLPKKGFKILPKIFEEDYNPGTVGDEGDRLITSVRGCFLSPHELGGEIITIWNESVLELSETGAELKRLVEEEVLDMSFEEEIVKDM